MLYSPGPTAAPPDVLRLPLGNLEQKTEVGCVYSLFLLGFSKSLFADFITIKAKLIIFISIGLFRCVP